MKRFLHLLPLLALLIAPFPAGPARSAPPSETQIKAAYLVNFAKLFEWPSGALGSGSDPFLVCLISQRDGIALPLNSMAGKNIQGHALLVKQNARLSELRDCRMVVLEAGDENRLPAVLEALADAPALTVGDFDEFSRRGGMIELAFQDNRIVFDINRDATNRARLSPSAQLLKLARIVRQK